MAARLSRSAMAPASPTLFSCRSSAASGASALRAGASDMKRFSVRPDYDAQVVLVSTGGMTTDHIVVGDDAQATPRPS